MKPDKYTIYAGMLCTLYFAIQVLPVKWTVSVSAYICPGLYLLLILSIVCLLPQMHVPGNRCFRQTIAGYAFSGAFIFLSMSYLLSVLLGTLSTTPYDISFGGIRYNLINLIPMIWSRELIRAYAVGTIWRSQKHPMMWTLILTGAFFLLEINVAKAVSLNDIKSVFIYLSKDVLPLLMKNILITILCYYGGAVSGVIYGLILAVFQRMFPFLPSLPWLADSALGIVFPIMFSMFINDNYQILCGRCLPKERGSTIGYGAALLVSVSFAWFAVGVFSVYPSVVLTGSMEPEIYPGDVILVKKIKEETELYQLQVGDIINFKRGDIHIIHRILEIRYDAEKNISFQTKGDNNASADKEIVNPNDIRGIVIAVIPKIGIPIRILRGKETIPEGVVNQ